MQQKTVFWLIWLGLIIYAFVFAPPNQPDTFEVKGTGDWVLVTGNWVESGKIMEGALNPSQILQPPPVPSTQYRERRSSPTCRWAIGGGLLAATC
jgi:hypothetical protein